MSARPGTKRRANIVAIAVTVLAASALVLATLELDPTHARPLVAAAHPSVRWITTADLARSLASATPPVLLDVRTAEEFAVSRLRGAVRVDPARPNLSTIPSDVVIAVYCSIGWRSGALADRLQREEHADVVNLEGGIFAWANQGRELVRGDRPVREVHPYGAMWGRMLRTELHARRAPRS